MAPGRGPVSERATWLRRVTVEFGVIVIGVLVALMAESWWQERGERAEELETLHRIDDDLAGDSTYLSLYGNWLDMVQPSFVAAREAVAGTSDLPPSGALALTYAAATEVTDGRPLSTWDELLASGGLADLDDPDLRRALVGFYTDFGTMAEAGRSLPDEYRIAVTAVIPAPVSTQILLSCLREDPGAATGPAPGPRPDVLRALRQCSAVDSIEARRHLAALHARSGFRESLEARAYEVAFVAERHGSAVEQFDSLRVHLDRVLGR